MHLFKNVRIHQIFGANTDVGKTIFGTALALGSASTGKNVRYLKPVSTGPMEDADDEFVRRYTARFAERVREKCLFRFKEPVSPHLALQLEHVNGEDKVHDYSDSRINSAISAYIASQVAIARSRSDIYIETAGGVHSPTLSGTSQVDGYRPLRLPVILIGDSKLGGISSTISSYESLLVRGYDIVSILLFKDSYYQNAEYLKPYFREREIPVYSFPAPPAKLEFSEANFKATDAYFSSLLASGALEELELELQGTHEQRIEELESMPQRVSKHIWWPFVQHKNVKGPEDVTVIDSASGDFFSTYTVGADENANRLAPLYDGSASWWTQTFGHGQPSLALASAKAAGRYGHVMFPQAVHAPALRLAESMLSEGGPGAGWASRVFFTDNGSCAMEVALKMAIRAFSSRHSAKLDSRAKSELGILGLNGSYHGDTIGVMNACSAGDGVYTCEWHSAKGFWLDPPTVSVKAGKVVISVPDSIAGSSRLDGFDNRDFESLQHIYSVQHRLHSNLADVYRRYIGTVLRNLASSQQRLAALVLEPLVLGSAGMIFVDPLFQRILIDSIREADVDTGTDGTWRGLPVIFDEVFTGMYRLGHQTCSSILGVKPDIAAYAKTLTGGVVPLALTLASKSIFDAFWDDSKGAALLHGHSYTAHAIGCEVANETLKMMDKETRSASWSAMRKEWNATLLSSDSAIVWSLWSPAFISKLSLADEIESAMTLGTVLTFKFKGDAEGYRSQLASSRLASMKDQDGELFGIHFRTLGDVAYFMTSLNTPQSIIQSVENRILKALGVPTPQTI